MKAQSFHPRRPVSTPQVTLALVAMLSACGDDTTPAMDSGTIDASRMDAGIDATMDAATGDASMRDASMDSVSTDTPDVPVDAGGIPGFELDDSFGSSGFVEFNRQASGAIQSMVRQSDGRVVYAVSNGTIARVFEDGLADLSFGVDGHFAYTTQQVSNRLYVDSSDRIYVVDRESTWRLLPNGTVDTDFGDGGLVEGFLIGIKSDGSVALSGVGGSTSLRLPNGDPDTSYGEMGFGPAVGNTRASLLLDDGRIVRLLPTSMAGTTTIVGIDADGSGVDFETTFEVELRVRPSFFADAEGRILLLDAERMIRFTPTGQVDVSFGTEGIVELGGAITRSTSFIGELPDGRIIIDRRGAAAVSADGDTITQFWSPTFDGYSLWQDRQGFLVFDNGTVTRLNFEGELQSDFDWRVPTMGHVDASRRITVAEDGDVYLGDGPLVRVRADGTIDEGFREALPSRLRDVGPVVALPSGQVLVDGSAVHRLNADGSIDPTFGYDGALAVGDVSDLGIDATGGIYVLFDNSEIREGVRVARLTSDGVYDPESSFGPEGAVEIPELDAHGGRLMFLRVLPNERILVCGAPSGRVPSLWRIFEPDGTLVSGGDFDGDDSSWQVIHAMEVRGDNVYAVAIRERGAVSSLSVLRMDLDMSVLSQSEEIDFGPELERASLALPVYSRLGLTITDSGAVMVGIGAGETDVHHQALVLTFDSELRLVPEGGGVPLESIDSGFYAASTGPEGTLFFAGTVWRPFTGFDSVLVRYRARE